MTERGPTLVVAAAIVRDNEILLVRRYQPELPEAHLKWEYESAYEIEQRKFFKADTFILEPIDLRTPT